MTSERSALTESADNQNKVFTAEVVTGTAIQPILDYAGMMSKRLKVLVMVGGSSVATAM